MSSHAMPSFPRTTRLVAGLALVAALAGCEDFPGIAAGSGDASAASAASGAAPGVVRIEERDVERPDIYSTEDRALWDGRFSLGGRWVAVPEDINAARVKITNLANGQEIEGALFRREVTLPGPPIMVSMDAAIALGMEAGSPVNMRIVVVRTEAIEVQAPPTATVEVPAADAATETAAAAPAQPAVPQDALQTSVLGALQSIASPPPPPPPAPAAEAAEAPADASSAATPALSGAGDFQIQVAGGTNKAGAEAVVKRLADAGLSASLREGTSQGKPFFRVFAGPYGDREAFQAALTKVRSLGYSDAFAVN